MKDATTFTSEIALALQDWVFPAIQILCVLLIFIGVALLSVNVRYMVASLYTSLVIRRLRVDTQTEARRLASSICNFLYLNPSGQLSAFKTLALATASFLLIAALLVNARVWYGSSACESPSCSQFNFVMFTWSGEKPDLSKLSGVPVESRSLDLQSADARSALPLTLAFHWLAEVGAGLLLIHFTQRYRQNFLFASSLGMLSFLIALSVAPTLLFILALNVLALSGIQPSWTLILWTAAAFANGPGLAFVSLVDIASFGHVIASNNPRTLPFALLSSITFAAGFLAILLANAATRSHVALRVLDFLMRNGVTRPVALILFSAGLFGGLTDASSSANAIASLLGKLFG